MPGARRRSTTYYNFPSPEQTEACCIEVRINAKLLSRTTLSLVSNHAITVNDSPGICNDIADCLSRFQMEKFRRLAPGSKVLPDCIPAWPTQSFMTPPAMPVSWSCRVNQTNLPIRT